jgi:hypothetical protein
LPLSDLVVLLLGFITFEHSVLVFVSDFVFRISYFQGHYCFLPLAGSTHRNGRYRTNLAAGRNIDGAHPKN